MLAPDQEDERVDHGLLDRAYYNHLKSQGMGTLELATQDLVPLPLLPFGRGSVVGSGCEERG